MLRSGLARALMRIREIRSQSDTDAKSETINEAATSHDHGSESVKPPNVVENEDIQRGKVQGPVASEAKADTRTTEDNSLRDSKGIQTVSGDDLEFLKDKHFAVAPMVKASDLPFRLLCRKAGATVCYTPMFYADLFATSFLYRCEVFQTCPEDRPLVVQICGHNAETLLKTAKLLEPFCDAIDLNFGCPLREGRRMGFGAWMLDTPLQRSMVLKTVQKLASKTSLPVFCKIRLLPDPDSTIKFCQELELAGCSQITIHARQRGQPSQRRFGPAFLSFVRNAQKAVRIPIFANGCIRSWEDVVRNLKYTGARGVMSAEAVLANPALFLPALKLLRDRQWDNDWPKGKKADALESLCSSDSNTKEISNDACEEESKGCNCCGVNFNELEPDSVFDPGNIEERVQRYPDLKISDEDVKMDTLTTEQESRRKAEQLRWVKARTRSEEDIPHTSTSHDHSKNRESSQVSTFEERTDEDRYNWIVPRTLDPILMAEEYISLVEAIRNSILLKAKLNGSLVKSDGVHSFTGGELFKLECNDDASNIFVSEPLRLKELVFDVQVGTETELENGNLDKDSDHIDLNELGKNIPPTVWVRNHIRHICDRELFKYQLRDQIEESKSLGELQHTLFILRMRRDQGVYKFDHAAHAEFLSKQREIMKRRRIQDKKQLKNARKRIKMSQK